MRRVTVLFAFVLACCALGAAQMMPPKPMEIPRTELYIGYSYLHADLSGSGYVNNVSLNGFALEVSHYYKSNLGFTIDIARTANGRVESTGIKYSRASYMGGPAYRLPKLVMFTPSVHAMAGVDHDDLTIPLSNTTLDYRNTDLAVAGGVALDGNLSRHLAVRLGQFDYIYTNHYKTNQSSYRYTGGVVVRF